MYCDNKRAHIYKPCVPGAYPEDMCSSELYDIMSIRPLTGSSV